MKTNTTKFIWVAFFVSLIAVGFFVYLMMHHYDLHYGQNAESAICNVSSAVNCDSISASSYSELFGIPVAVLGLMTHLALLGLLFGLALNMFEDTARASRMSFYLSSINLVASIIMAIISFAVLKTLCIFCTGTYITAALIFIFLFLSLPQKGFSALIQDIGETLTTHKLYLIPTLGVLVSAWLIDTAMEKRYGANDLQIRVIETYSRMLAQTPLTFDETNGVIKGSAEPNPTLKIVEFIDFRCPHCKIASNNLNSFVSTRNDVQVMIKNFPLDSSCNPNLQQGDGISCHLAFLAYCSDKLAKKGWDATQFIFQNQDSFRMSGNKSEFTQQVSNHVGLDSTQMDACTKDNETFQAIQNQANEGKGITGTPAIYMNGRLLPGAPGLPILQQIYEKIKSEAGK